jgi:hypothetical protein
MQGAKRKAVIQSEDVIGETHSVCVMVLAPQVGLVLKQANENMRRVPHRGVDDLLVEAFRAPVLRAQCRGGVRTAGLLDTESVLESNWLSITESLMFHAGFTPKICPRCRRGVGGGRFEGATHGLWNSR